MVTYDDQFFYVGFQFDDPDPRQIRGPLGDHDAINGQADDMGGLFLDGLNTGRTAILFLVNARNVQYDAVVDDASGENQSPDFFWDSATKITDRGWNLEIRIPFSSLRYKNTDPQTWGMILYRNYPRGFRYQIASARFPRGGNCTVCRANRLTGMERLPSGGHLVVAPYASASEAAQPRDGVAGAALVGQPATPHAAGSRALLPCANGSSIADRDFASTVLLARAKRDVGLSFVSALVTDRENRDGEGHNRVAGPDFQWRWSPADVVTGQVLFSDSRTPNRRTLADEWN